MKKLGEFLFSIIILGFLAYMVFFLFLDFKKPQSVEDISNEFRSAPSIESYDDN